MSVRMRFSIVGALGGTQHSRHPMYTQSEKHTLNYASLFALLILAPLLLLFWNTTLREHITPLMMLLQQSEAFFTLPLLKSAAIKLSHHYRQSQ